MTTSAREQAAIESFREPPWKYNFSLLLFAVGLFSTFTGAAGLWRSWDFNHPLWEIISQSVSNVIVRSQLLFWPYVICFGALTTACGWLVCREAFRWALFSGALAMAAFCSAVLTVSR